MAKKAVKPATKNGRVLTAKHLAEDSYQVFHTVPFGLRQDTLKALINMAVPYAKKNGQSWYHNLTTGKAKIV